MSKQLSEDEISIRLQEITADTDMTDTQFIKLLQFVKSLIADREREAIENYIAPFIKGCEEQNGLPYCKNCGLSNPEEGK